MAIRETRFPDIATNRNLPSNSLSFPFFVPQDKDNLCWAACTASILSYYGKLNGKKLCDVVMDMKALGSCCPPLPTSVTAWQVQATCNKTIKVDKIKPKWEEKYDLESEFLSGPLSDKKIFEEIENHRRPLMIKVDTLEDVKHLLIIYGWQKGGNNPITGSPYKFLIFNPEGFFRNVDYDDLLPIWQATWWKLRKIPA